MQMTPEQKQAATHWLLAEGECEHWNLSTSSAFAVLLRRGINFETSEAPQFGRITVNTGQYDECTVETVHARIEVLNPDQMYDSFEFYIPADRWQEMVMQAVIAGSLAAGSGTPEQWQARVNERWLAEIDRAEERAAAVAAAAEQKKAARKRA